jgi:hypothetical protein
METLALVFMGFGVYGLISAIKDIIEIISLIVTNKRIGKALDSIDEKYSQQLENIRKEHDKKEPTSYVDDIEAKLTQ